MTERRKARSMSKTKVRPRAAGQPASAHLILGEDLYMRDIFREKIVASALEPDEREFGLVKYELDRSSLEEALGRARSLPMFAQRQVLVLSRLEKMREDDLTYLEAYWAEPSPATVLIFEAGKLDRRTRASKLLLKHCELYKAEVPDDAAALTAVGKFARELNMKLTREAAEDLVFALGSALGPLRQELEKLQTYVGEGAEVRPEDVATLVSPARRFSVFEMADLLAERRRDRALMRLRRLLNAGESPIGVVGVLAYVYRQLLRARQLPRGASSFQAARVLRMQSHRVEPLLRQARKFSTGELQRAFGLLLETDVALKSSAPDPVALVETLVIRLTEPAERKMSHQTGENARLPAEA